MAVHMHGMSASRGVVIHNEPDALAVPKIIDIRFGGKFSVAKFCLEQQWVVVVCPECGVVHVKQIVCPVGLESNGYVLSRFWSRWGECEVWHSFRQMIIFASLD